MPRKIRVPEPPLLQVIAYPAAFKPVVITLESDYELTGEVSVSDDVTTEQLWEVKLLMSAIVNALADEIWSRERGEPPFEPTGKRSPDGELPAE